MPKVRTCPNCKHQVKILQYLKRYLFKTIFSTFPCEECGVILKFSIWRRVFIALFIVFFAFTFRFFFMFIEEFRVDFGSWKYVIYILYLGLPMTVAFMDALKIKPK